MQYLDILSKELIYIISSYLNIGELSILNLNISIPKVWKYQAYPSLKRWIQLDLDYNMMFKLRFDQYYFDNIYEYNIKNI